MIVGKLLNVIYVKLQNIRFLKNNSSIIKKLDHKLFKKYDNLYKEKEAININPRLCLPQYNNSTYFQTRLNDATIHYREFFPNNEYKDKIILVHGFGANTSYYDNIIPLLTNSGYYCLSIDLPGWGLSSKSFLYTQEVRGNQINCLLKYINNKNKDFRKWIAIGHSMGGGCVLNMKQKYLKKKIVLSPATNLITNNFIKAASIYLEKIMSLISQKKIFIDNIIGFSSYERIDEKIYNKLVEQLPDSKTIIRTLVEGFETNNLANNNKKIPVFILWSDKDAVIGIKASDDIENLLKNSNAKIKYISGSHLYTLNYPKETVDYILHCINYHNNFIKE